MFVGKNALAYSFEKDKICLKQVFEDLFANLFKKETSAELTFAGSQHWCNAILSTCYFINLLFFQLYDQLTVFYAFFVMHQNLRHFLYRTAVNLRQARVDFMTVNLLAVNLKKA
jgi:hypothetical protein